MSNVLRSTTFQLEFKGQDGITGIRQFTKAVTNADEVVDELSKTLGENTEVTVKNVKSKKELVSDGRRLVSQIERTKGKVAELTRQYEHQSKAVNRTADEQEVLNAIYKLGAHATQKQKDEVSKLVTNYQKVRAETTKVQGGFRNLRGVSQNLGWQLQDVAVQAQMGTNAFTIFAQQGSQMASAFGPAGALVGAFIAVGGAIAGSLLPNLFGADKAAKKLTETMEEWKKTIGLTAEQIEYLSDLETKNNKEIKESIKSRDKEIKQAQTTIDNGKLVIKNYEKNSKVYKNLIKARKDANKIIITETALRQAEQTQLDKSAEKVKAYQDALNRGTDQTKVIEDLLTAQNKMITANDEGKSSVMELQKAEELALATKNKATDTELMLLELTWDQNIATQKAIEVAKAELVVAKALEKVERDRAKREAARFQIEKAQAKQLKGDNGKAVELGLFIKNIKLLNAQKLALGEDELDEDKRINALIEQEVHRHNAKMDDLNLKSMQSGVATFAMGSQQITSIANLMADGVEQVENATAEMTSGQKAAFLLSQGIAAAMAVVNGISLGGKLAEMFPLAAPAMVATGTGLGVANASAIMSTTFAGMFDKGGQIPGGQVGIVSEYGDELVNGQLVKGPANVTSREDTAKMMGGGNTKIIIENKISGATYTTQQVDENTVKVIAEKVFSDNIDNGVSGVMSNRNSKTTKAMKGKFNVRSNY